MMGELEPSDHHGPLGGSRAAGHIDWRPEFINGVPRHSRTLIERYRSDGYWGELTIIDRFDAMAREFPTATAVVDGTTRLSYAQLNELTLAFAAHLGLLGVRPGDIVTIQLPNWWEHVVALLGTVRAGGVAAPVNVRVRSEIEYVLETTESSVIIIPETFHGFSHVELLESIAHRLPTLRHRVVVRGPASSQTRQFTDLIQPDIVPNPKDLPALDAASPWEIMFTSGTTSRPKGVLRTHDNTLFTIRLLDEHYHILGGAGQDVALAVLPISFVYAQYVCELGALLTGGTLVLSDGFDALQTLRLVESERVSVLPIVPSMMPDFKTAFELLENPRLDSLRVVAPAGEAVTRERKQECASLFGCDVRECYGLAEVTMPLVQPALAPWENKLSCTGQVNPATEVAIVDESGAAVESDAAGELLVRSPTLFPGYYKNPEATYAAIDEDGWFHTGDLVRSFGNGFFGIAGRRKDLIKRGGVSVVPQDVEDALEGHPDVAAAAVFGLAAGDRGEIVCACVVPRQAADVSPEDLQSYLVGRIASFKIPERIELVDALPVSGNGKVMKNELAARLLGRD